jgi:tRNA dimethylallyltransferase
MRASAATDGRRSWWSICAISISGFCADDSRRHSDVTQPDDVIVTLMGPTASGKTELAMRLADALPVEIISVDSAMVYRQMSIGTAKPDAAVLARYPHRLIDLKDPAESYSVGEFVEDAKTCVAAALKAGRVPLLVGGTMLYFKAFKSGIADLPETSSDTQRELEQRAQRLGLAALHEELRRVDPVAAAGIHPNNRQRLLRALEVYGTTGRPISEFWARQRDSGIAQALGCRLFEFAIEVPREAVNARIERRFDEMLRAGLLEEVRALMARGDLSVQQPSIRAVGYRQVWRHLSGEFDHATMVERAVAATRQLAKRQRTWLRSWSGKTVLNDAAEAGRILQSIRGDRIVPPSS